jgi:hypothetical protein
MRWEVCDDIKTSPVTTLKQPLHKCVVMFLCCSLLLSLATCWETLWKPIWKIKTTRWEYHGGSNFWNIKNKKTYNRLEINFEIIFENKSRFGLILNLKPKVIIKVGLVRPKTIGQKIKSNPITSYF